MARLTVSAGSAGGGLGHAGLPLLFRNASTTTGTLRGSRGVAAPTATGVQAMQASRSPSGYLGGLAQGVTTPPVVTLAPGQTASAQTASGLDGVGLVESLSASPDGIACTVFSAFLVTPRNETHPVRPGPITPRLLADRAPRGATGDGRRLSASAV